MKRKQKLGTVKNGYLKEAEIEIYSYRTVEKKKIFVAHMRAGKDYEDGKVESSIKKLFEWLTKELVWEIGNQ